MADRANAVSRLAALPTDTIVEPRVLRGFQTLFNKIDARIAQIVEDGVARGTLAKRVTVPRLDADSGQLVQPVRERYQRVINADELEVVRTVRELRPRPPVESFGPAPPGPTCTPH